MAGFAGGEAMGLEEFWDVDCQILVPAALAISVDTSVEGSKRTVFMLCSLSLPINGDLADYVQSATHLGGFT